MRLVCPNCEAKYEVPEDAIPDVGRDVQCASCGHSWFQMRPRPAGAVAEPPQPATAEPELTTPELADAEAVASDSVALAEAGPAEAVEDIPTAELTVAEDPIVEEPAVEPPVADMPEADTAATELTAAEDAAAEPDGATAESVEAGLTTAADTAPDTVLEPEVEPEVEPIPVIEADSAAVVPPLAGDDAVAALAPQPSAEDAFAGDADTSFEPAVEGVAPSEPEAESQADPAPAQVAAAAYAVDESVLAILREEAEREAQARRAEVQTLESQTDLGLDAAMPGRTKPAAFNSNGAAPDQISDAALKPSARRDLLPDVEEINSTLRPSEAAVPDFIQSGPPQSEQRGFRSGFLMVMTVAIIGTAIYTAAPSLSVMVPALAGPLEVFVGAVDSLRLSLDGIMQSATVAINGG